VQVSNVINRESFITVLEDVLGFESKVEFNAGVITAGRAKIQSDSLSIYFFDNITDVMYILRWITAGIARHGCG
jgi:hypothetical protein